jgi:type I restriction enzyme R subunit
MPKSGEEFCPLLTTCKNIVVVPDEAQRIYSGSCAVLENETGCFRYGYAKHMKDALQVLFLLVLQAHLLEMITETHNTVFGDYVSRYYIQYAAMDDATMPIYYESHMVKLDINRVKIAKLNNEVEGLLEDDEDIVFREKAKSQWAILEKLVEAEQRLKGVAEYFIKHFELRNNIIEGKGMIVCMRRNLHAPL